MIDEYTFLVLVLSELNFWKDLSFNSGVSSSAECMSESDEWTSVWMLLCLDRLVLLTDGLDFGTLVKEPVFMRNDTPDASSGRIMIGGGVVLLNLVGLTFNSLVLELQSVGVPGLSLPVSTLSVGSILG